MKIVTYSLIVFVLLGTAGMIFLQSADAAIDNNQNRGLQNVELMANKIAQKFGLNNVEVEKFIQENRNNAFKGNRYQNKGKGLENRLEEIVKSGKLTEEKRQNIIQKREEWRDEMRKSNFSSEERMAIREKHKKEMESLFQKYGIEPFSFNQRARRNNCQRLFTK